MRSCPERTGGIVVTAESAHSPFLGEGDKTTLRVYLNDREFDALGELSSWEVVNDPTKKVRTRNIIRFNPHPDIIYELIPNLVTLYKGSVIWTNSAGFRGLGVPAEKTPGGIRIAGLGDSVMLGWSVKEDELYLAVLSEKLNPGIPRSFGTG